VCLEQPVQRGVEGGSVCVGTATKHCPGGAGAGWGEYHQTNFFGYPIEQSYGTGWLATGTVQSDDETGDLSVRHSEYALTAVVQGDCGGSRVQR